MMGKRIYKKRSDLGLTLQQAADRLGISYEQFRKYEKGINSLTIPAMKLVAEALEVDACEICGCCDDG